MARLLVVHHTPSPAMQELLESALAGARDPALADLGGGLDVQVRPALTAGPADALEADGYLLATPANIGYISGALKHFFDTIYYPCLEATRGRPFAAYVHGNLDQAGRLTEVPPGVEGRHVRFRQVGIAGELLLEEGQRRLRESDDGEGAAD